MPTAVIDGLDVYYEVHGSGEPLLLLAPGGFDATIEKWRVASAWTGMNALEALAERHRVIVYDRRESGGSGGRVERLSWAAYARQAKMLLEHLGVESAGVLGGCMGCSVALSFAVHFPGATRALMLHWPVGGYRWKASCLERFDRHLRFAKGQGLAAVVERAHTGKIFWSDAEAGPWASAVVRDPRFAKSFAAENLDRYLGIVSTTGRSMFDRDTATGAEPEEILGIDCPCLIIPGNDDSHATSAAYYLRECLRKADFWSVFPADQTTRNVCERILEFCRTAL